MTSFTVKCSGGLNSSLIGSPGGAAVNEAVKIRNKIHKIGTWNVRGMMQTGKLQIIEGEMDRADIAVLGVAETHWRDSGHFRTHTGNTVYASGNGLESRNGVAVIVSRQWADSVMEYRPITDRIITLRFNTQPCRINVIQVYAPTLAATEEETNEFYRKLQQEVRTVPSKDLTIIQGDFNAKVGKELSACGIFGCFGLGERNENGDRLVEFCQEDNYVILNTCYQQHPRRLYTWTSPGGLYRNQIDYCLINGRWRSAIKNAKTIPGADCGTDHQLLCIYMKLKLAKLTKQSHTARKLEAKEMEKFRSRIQPVLQNQERSESTAQVWKTFKDNTQKVVDELVKERKKKPPKAPWISQETICEIESRRDLKAEGKQHTEEYRRASARVRRGCRKDKNLYYEDICKKIEEHSEQNETRAMFQEIKRITRTFKLRTYAIEDENAVILTEQSQIAERWKSYCQKLYEDPEGKLGRIPLPAEKEPSILKDEVRAAIRKLRNNKAPGEDGITAEMIKATGEVGVEIMHRICCDIWTEGVWIEDWTRSVFVPLHKKGSTNVCGNYRTISLMSHASKVLLNILHERVRYFLNDQIPKEQAGFVRNKGTREQIQNVRQLVEKCREYNVPLVMGFLDYSKAFDCVRWKMLWQIMEEMGVPAHLIALIRNLYADSRAAVRLQEGHSPDFEASRGVRQGCILSPVLFNIYGEYIMRKSLEEWKGGVRVGGQKISNLRFADDTTLCASSESELEQLLKRVEKTSNELGLTLNRGKTKIMIVDRAHVLPQTDVLKDFEKVEKMLYLGSLIDSNGGSTAEIRRRIVLAREATVKLTKIWKDRNLTRNIKLRLLRTLVFPIFLYGAETWTIKAGDRERIDAFEMWTYRRMLRIPWTAKRTNVSILNELRVQQRLSSICYQRILRFFGHIVRRPGENLEKLVVQGKVEGKRSRGRSPKRWLDQIEEMTDRKLERLVRDAEDREEWRAMVDGITVEGNDGSRNAQP